VIFVTVGTQTPFDRLVQAADAWAHARGRRDVFMQIGAGDCVPRHATWARFLEPTEFQERFRRATLLVAHAGTGSILQALQAGRPLLVLPRRAALGETRNDHQLATCAKFADRGLAVAWTEQELGPLMDRHLAARSSRGPASLAPTDREGWDATPPLGPDASPELLGAVRRFLAQ
jgi:UDP-N-acetylglucosamine transferase subunit ALG13